MSLIPAGTDSVSGLFKSAAQAGDVLQLPNPSATTLGGVESIAAVSHNFLTSISTLGVPTLAQPAFTDISGSVAAGQMPALTGDVTTSAGAIATTLATVNSNVGSFTSANITVNGKGLITAAANGTGGGTPGGTSGQSQYNNAGSFGGYTVSGDATLNTSTGALTFGTVNSNVGSFTSANITVNAKGLITAAANGTSTAGGSTGQVQYNNAGALAGVTGITLSSGTLSTISFANIYQINNAMQMFDGASTKAADVPARRLWDNAGTGLSIDWNSRIGVNSAGTTMLDWSSTSGIQTTKFFKYNTVPLQGNGLISIPGWGPRVVGATAAQTLATFLPTADGSFYVSANLLVTTATLFSVSVTCTYTDEGGTSRTATLSFSQLTGTILNLITNTQGAGPYEGIPLHIRVKGNTTITIQTAGTFTTVTYNGEGSISQIA